MPLNENWLKIHNTKSSDNGSSEMTKLPVALTSSFEETILVDSRKRLTSPNKDIFHIHFLFHPITVLVVLEDFLHL